MDDNEACAHCGLLLCDDSRCPACSDRYSAPSPAQIQQRARAIREQNRSARQAVGKPKTAVEPGGIRLFSARLLGRTLQIKYLGVA